MEKGDSLLIVLSGPSGAGKGTLCRELLRLEPNLQYSVSATTRQPRPAEVEGVHYFFRTKAEFKEMIAKGELLEWAEFCGNYYGTPIFGVEQALAAGKDVILEIETQGALQVKKRSPHGLFVFVIPPSLEALSDRIHKRGTEAEDVIAKRLATARQEIKLMTEYDYVVVNDEVPAAVHKLRSIIVAEKCRVERNRFLFKEEHS